MNKPPVDAKILPSEEKMQRAEIADILFEAHGEINKAIGRAALDIADDAPIPAALDIAQKKVEAILRIMIKAAYLRAGLTFTS